MRELLKALCRNPASMVLTMAAALALSLWRLPPAAAGVTKTVLPNGLCVIVKPEPGNGLVAIEAFVKVGAAQERSPLMGIGNLVARIILTSTINRSPARLAATFEEVGGSFRTDWSPDFTEISAITTVTHFDEAMNVLADVLLNAEFEPETVERAKETLIAEIRGSTGGVFEAAYNQLLESLYKDNPYRRPKSGYARCVRRITRDEILAFYRQWYIPSNIVISVAGDVTEQQVLERLKRAFAGTNLTQTPLQRPVGDETLAQSGSRITEKDTFVTYIMIGYLAPGVGSPDFPAVAVASAILGGGKASRLFTNLREQRGIGYEVGTIYPILRNQSHLVALVVTDLYKPKVPGAPNQVALQEVKDAILAEVASLRDRPVSDEELLRAKHYAAGSHALKHERLRERAFSLGWMEAIGIGYQFDLDFGTRIEAVTKEEVQRVARKYLTNHTMTVILPKNTPAFGSPFSGN